MVPRSRAVIVLVSMFGVFAALSGDAAAQDPSQTASNEVTFVGSWVITAGSGAGDADDYCLIFFRPGRALLPLNVDEEDIDGMGDFRVQESGTWRMQFTVEDNPQDCAPLDCIRATIRHLQRDGTLPNRWHLGLKTHDTESDLDLILDRIVPTLEVTSPNPLFGDFQLVTAQAPKTRARYTQKTKIFPPNVL
jgi:hypothetical protein